MAGRPVARQRERLDALPTRPYNVITLVQFFQGSILTDRPTATDAPTPPPRDRSRAIGLGREAGPWGYEAYTETKSIMLDTTGGTTAPLFE